MIKKRDFIISGPQRWDIKIGSNAKDIATEIAKHNRVLYVNTPNEKPSPEFKITEVIKDHLWTIDTPVKMVPVNGLPDGFLFDIVNHWNQKRFYAYVRKAIKLLEFDNTILFIDNDIYRGFYAIEELTPTFSIYYRRDNMVSHYWKKHAPRLEPMLCAKVNCVLSNSEELGAAVAKFTKHTYNVGQGVNLENYIEHVGAEVETEFANIPGPIIGYAGAITSLRLDANLIFTLAQRLPNYSFVMVGGEDPTFKQHKVHSLNNVYFLGAKPSELVPQYISAFDICINPQVLNEITVGNYPRKVDEYLSLGKPVVATLTSTMTLFSKHVHCCNNVEEWIKAFEDILQGRHIATQQERIEFAYSHSWSASVEKIYQQINQLSK